MRDLIVIKADLLAHEIYKITRNFPSEELYGLTSQIRRSTISIVLNLIEGFARNNTKEYIRFIDIAYASLKETKYLIHFCYIEKHITQSDYNSLLETAEEIGKLIWNKKKRLKEKQKNKK